MMDGIGRWLLGIVVTALVLSLTDIVIPKGTIQKIAALTGGLILLAALVRPMVRVNLPEGNWDITQYRETIEQQQKIFQNETQEKLKERIATETETYLCNEAIRQGVCCQFEVLVEMGTEGEPMLTGVTGYGVPTEAFQNWIEDELGIPRERQVWHDREQG